MRLPKPTPHRPAALAAVACLWLVCAAAPAAAQTCTQIDLKRPETLDSRVYRVREVRVETQLDFLHAVSNYLKETKAKLPLKAGSDYPLALPPAADGKKTQDILSGISAGRRMIEARLDEAETDDPRSRIRVVFGRIENCQDGTPPQLDVVYRIFLTNYDSYFSHTFELKSKEVEKPATAAAEAKAEEGLMLRPTVGYNRTRRLFGGGSMRMKMQNGMVDSMGVDAHGSPTSNVEEFDMEGSRTPGLAALNRFEYRLSYEHSDLPAAANRLRRGTLSFQAFGASKPLGGGGVVLRYGTSLEGGNQQTDLDAAAAAQASAADSGYGGLKAYVGATASRDAYTLAGSYGLQVGTRGATTDVDFVKHLADVMLTARLFKPKGEPGRFLKGKPGEVHKALTVEARVTGGRIENRGLVPVTERFFGGNRQRNFIDGDNWSLLSGPFIRSIPENRLTAAAGDVGGTSFYSANLTIGREVWGFPLLPKEIASDPEFDSALNASVESSRSILRNTYLRKVPAYVAFAASVPSATPPGSAVTLGDWLTGLKKTLDGLPDKLPEDFDSDRRDEIETDSGVAAGEIVKMLSKFRTGGDDLPSVLSDYLTEKDSRTCFKSDEENECSRLTTVRIYLKRLAPMLTEAGLATDAAALLDAEAELERRQRALVGAMSAIDISLATRMADDDMEDVTTALEAFVNELNAVAISPVAVFDAARVRPDAAGTRFGVGGGARLSLLNFNLTLGYSFNPRRRAGEGRGAFFFSMDFTDIFR